jgi:phosphoglycerol transferase MdoB-like AlkP superfamily enzyme
LNTPYNFFTTLSYPHAEKITFFTTDNEAVRVIQNSMHSNSNKIEKQKSNVVVIILESFSREYMGIGNHGKGYTPFLDSLAMQSVFFDHHFANGRKSIEAVPAIFASIPSLVDEPFTMGVYQTNEVRGLASILAKQGYHTAFFHGGKNGTMGFNQFAKNVGFQEYYGRDEYPFADRDFDGNWGIYDEPYLSYFNKKISAFKSPFLACVFTLSSHQPYSLPDKYKGVFPKGPFKVQETIGYTDMALRNFFKEAAKEKWYDNTLFVLLADHTMELSTPTYNNTIGMYRVPLLFFHPKIKIPLDTSQVSQHVDVMPTLLDYLGIENPKPILFGRSLFASSEGRALFFANQNYYYYKKNQYIEFDKKSSFIYNAHDYTSALRLSDKEAERKQMEKELKAYIQYFTNGLIHNSWYTYTLNQ